MRVTVARLVLFASMIAVAVNFIAAYRQADHVLWAGICFAIVVLAFIASEWLQLRHNRQIENIERARRDSINLDRDGNGEGA